VRYLDEYRSPDLVLRLVDRIRKSARRRWVIMEVCGGQTHSIVRHGLDQLLADSVELLHGPGCPVCVTAVETLDRAHALASRPNVLFASFGDMLRVPGSRTDLLGLRARGADVRVVYSPLDALCLAREDHRRSVVFFGIGFETTAPANAMALREARRLGVTSFSMLASHVLVPPALTAILESGECRVQGLLAPGHVCAVAGYEAYVALARSHRTPIAVTGFEPVDLLNGIADVVEQLEAGTANVHNCYARAARQDGNSMARGLVDEVFEVTDQRWRGIGTIPSSGLRIRPEYAAHDAERVFDVPLDVAHENDACMSGLVLRGQKKPCDCPAFGTDCTPASPLGATMVSAEGACAAYYASGRRRLPLASSGSAK
jgi:hydrogenase expression/formation protein HypD